MPASAWRMNNRAMNENERKPVHDDPSIEIEIRDGTAAAEDKTDEILLQVLKQKTGKEGRNERLIRLEVFADGSFAGGLLAKTQFEACYLDLLAVKSEYRKLGLGKQLLEELEKRCRSLGIRTIWLTTQDYQAPAFYKKNGYICQCRLDNFPFEGTSRFLFLKRLNES